MMRRGIASGRGAGASDGGYADVYHVASSNQVGRSGGPPVHRRQAFIDQPSRLRAGDARAAGGDEDVEAFAVLSLDGQAEALLRQVSFFRHIVSLRVRKTTMATTPTVIEESATLKAGQCGHWMKSVTSPTRTRSLRLPMAPPS